MKKIWNTARPGTTVAKAEPGKHAQNHKTLPVSDRLYRELTRQLIVAIESGFYRVGGRLPAERELAAQYKVSRPTVREALISLEVQGLVEVRVGSGTYVQRLPGAQDAPRFTVTAFELTEARLLFEGEAAALAATMITDEELDQLEALVRQIESENFQGGGERADQGFHLLIAHATHNVAIESSIEELWRLRSTSPECALLHQKARTAQVKPVVEEHRAILKALRSRDPARARAAMRAHLGAVMDHLLFATEARAVEEAHRSTQDARARFRRVAAT